MLINKAKKSLFDVDERIEMLQEETAQYGNVSVEAFHGLLVDFCRDRNIPAIVKGLRAVSDFDYELQMAQMNHSLAGVETFYSSRRILSTASSPPAWSRRLRRTAGMSLTCCRRRFCARLVERLTQRSAESAESDPI